METEQGPPCPEAALLSAPVSARFAAKLEHGAQLQWQNFHRQTNTIKLQLTRAVVASDHYHFPFVAPPLEVVVRRLIPLTVKTATLSPDKTTDDCRGGVDASKFSSQDWTLAYRQVLVLKNPAGGKVDAPCAACFDSITWCRVENIPPLLKIGVHLLPSAVRLWRLCCHAHDSDARDIFQLFFGRSLFYMSFCS